MGGNCYYVSLQKYSYNMGCVKYVDQMEETHGFPYTGPLAGNQLDQASQALMGLIQLIHVLDAPMIGAVLLYEKRKRDRSAAGSENQEYQKITRT